MGSLKKEEKKPSPEQENHLLMATETLACNGCQAPYGDGIALPLLQSGKSPLFTDNENVSSELIRIHRPVFTQKSFDSHYSFAWPQSAGLSGAITRRIRGFRCSPNCVRSAAFRLLPCISIMQQYRPGTDLVPDLVAGLTVCIMNIPQGMAYSLLAGLQPVYGLYLGFVPLLVYFVFGTSRQMAIGTFAIASLMVSVPVARLGQGPTEELLDSIGPPPSFAAENATDFDEARAIKQWYRAQVALSVSFLAGFLQFLFGLLRFGIITTYLSTPLVSGFTTGAAMHVLSSQVPAVFGIRVPRRQGRFELAGFYIDVAKQLGSTNPVSVLVSVVSLTVLLLFRLYLSDRLRQKCRFPVPVELLLVVGATVVSHFAQLGTNYGLRTVGEIPKGLYSPSMPPVRLWPAVLQDALILAIVMYVCTYSVCKMYAERHGYALDSNQEFLASGLVNTIGPIFGCYFSAGSLSRSQVQDEMGGRSQVASLVAAILMLFVLLFLGPLFHQLPNAVLSCIVVSALKGLLMQFVDAKRLYRISKYDFSIWVVCFLGVVLLNVTYGLLVGFTFSLLTVVCRTQSPNAAILGRLPSTDIYKDNCEYHGTVKVPGVTIFRFDGALYFASVENFRRKLIKMSGFDPKSTRDTNGDQPLHHIVVDCSGINYMDSVGASSLKVLAADYRISGITLMFANCPSQFRCVLERSDFADLALVYVSVHDAVVSALAEYPDERHSILLDGRCRLNSSAETTGTLLEANVINGDCSGDLETSAI